MRSTAFALGLAALSAPLLLAAPAVAKPTAQSVHCASSAKDHKLTGSQRATFMKSCMKGLSTPDHPTAPTGTSKEAQAVTKPSGVDRTTRTQQCAAEGDRKRLTGKDRKAFQLSCLATAGPVSEGQNGTKSPAPAHSIDGIGVNNYKPGAAPPKSTPVAKP